MKTTRAGPHTLGFPEPWLAGHRFAANRRPHEACLYCIGAMAAGRVPAAWDQGRCNGTREFASIDSVKLLAEEFSGADPTFSAVVLGANTDPYPLVESRLQITRSILEMLRNLDHPLVITTRSALILRDLDLLLALAHGNLVRIFMAMNTLDAHMAHKLEPQASSPLERLHAIQRMADLGLHAGVLLTPVIPGLTNTELEGVLEAAAASGAGYADYAVLQLAPADRAPVTAWLQHEYPQRAKMVVGLLDEMDKESCAAPASPHGLAAPMTGFTEQFARRFDQACHRFLLDPVEAPLCCHGFALPPFSR